jgi:HSP20 family molecular chaperone IbpA
MYTAKNYLSHFFERPHAVQNLPTGTSNINMETLLKALNPMFKDVRHTSLPTWTQTTNETNITLEFSVIVHDPSDVEIDVTNSDIRISALKKEGTSSLVTPIDLSFELPNDVDSGKIEANISNGILTLILHKKVEKEPSKIKIRF